MSSLTLKPILLLLSLTFASFIAGGYLLVEYQRLSIDKQHLLSQINASHTALELARDISLCEPGYSKMISIADVIMQCDPVDGQVGI